MFPEQAFRKVGQNARRLILRMLDKNQDTRISAADALRHPWFSSPVAA
jgi:serine/threonine protein kinase